MCNTFLKPAPGGECFLQFFKAKNEDKKKIDFFIVQFILHILRTYNKMFKHF